MDELLFRLDRESVIIPCFAAIQGCETTENGKVAEWSNALDSKSSVRLYRTVGSNPTLSANTQKNPLSSNESRDFFLAVPTISLLHIFTAAFRLIPRIHFRQA